MRYTKSLDGETTFNGINDGKGQGLDTYGAPHACGESAGLARYYTTAGACTRTVDPPTSPPTGSSEPVIVAHARPEAASAFLGTLSECAPFLLQQVAQQSVSHRPAVSRPANRHGPVATTLRL